MTGAYFAAVHFQTVQQAGSRAAAPSMTLAGGLVTYNTTLLRALNMNIFLPPLGPPTLSGAFLAEMLRRGRNNLSCACTIDVEARSGDKHMCTDGTALAAGRATPDCFLCGAAWGDAAAPAGCSVGASGGSEAARAVALAGAQAELERNDRDVLRLLYSTAVGDGPASRAEKAQAGQRLAPWAFGDEVVQDELRKKAMMGAVVALAMVVLSLYVHKEAARAWTLARIILTHTGLLPPFYRPLSVASGRNLESWGGPREAGRNALLLFLPLAQAAVAFVVLMAGARAFASTDQTAGSLISIVYNSAALLFVLEIDNAAAAMILDQDRIAPPQAELREQPVQGASEAVARPRLCRAAGHAAAALLGAACFAEPLLATDVLALAGSLTTCFESNCTGYNRWMGARMPVAVFACAYALEVLLFFEPPLPVTAGAAASGAYRAAHKLAVVTSMALAVSQAWRWSSRLVWKAPDAIIATITWILIVYLAVSGALWLALYAVVPAAAACARACAHARIGDRAPVQIEAPHPSSKPILEWPALEA